jgi:hypothetical protein
MAATIYKIYCLDSKITECYVGSTEDYNRRCSEHKSDCNNEHSKGYNLKVYKYIRANGGFDNFIIEQIIDCNVENKYIEEQRWFELLQPTLNTNYPKRNKKQYKIDNKEFYQQYNKQYYENNKQQISEQNKQYRIANKEHYQQYNKQYQIDNKKKIAEKGKIKIHCECDSKYIHQHKARHIKTIKHQNYINSKL